MYWRITNSSVSCGKWLCERMKILTLSHSYRSHIGAYKMNNCKKVMPSLQATFDGKQSHNQDNGKNNFVSLLLSSIWTILSKKSQTISNAKVKTVKHSRRFPIDVKWCCFLMWLFGTARWHSKDLSCENRCW